MLVPYVEFLRLIKGPLKLLSALEKGRYVLLPMDEAPDLTEEQEAGLEAALASVRAGKGVSLEEVRAKLKPQVE